MFILVWLYTCGVIVFQLCKAPIKESLSLVIVLKVVYCNYSMALYAEFQSIFKEFVKRGPGPLRLLWESNHTI